MIKTHNKILTLLLSVLAAVLLWIYVVSSVAPETTGTVGSIPITVDGGLTLEERGLVVTDQSASRMSLELSTSRSILSKLTAENIRITADASKIQEAGEYSLSCKVTFPDTVNANEIDIIRRSVDMVKITVDKLESKTIPITLNWTGSVKDGYLFEVETVVLDPAEVTITGPKAELDKVSQAVVNYDISDLDQTTIEVLPLSLCDEEGTEVELSELCSASVDETMMTMPIARTKELKLEVKLIEGGGVKAENAKVTLDVETIHVKGAATVLDQMEDTFVVGSIDLAEVLDREERTFELTLPAGVSNISGETEVTATIVVTGVLRAEFNVSNIEIVNQPGGNLHAETSTRTVKVMIRGATSEVRSMTVNDIRILVDLTGYDQTGAYTVPGRVVISKFPGVGVVGTVEIGVTITHSGEVDFEEG